jgi:hypothetical protein
METASHRQMHHNHDSNQYDVMLPQSIKFNMLPDYYSEDFAEEIDQFISTPLLAQHTLGREGYPYTADLQYLDRCRGKTSLPPAACNITSCAPIKVNQWENRLRDHPDQAYM